MTSPEPNRLFHLTGRADWDAALARGAYEAESLTKEGFIHLSTADQVLGTAERHFAGRGDLVVLAIDPGLLTAPVRMEEAHGELFPHLYGRINLEAVVETIPLERGPDGRFELPALSD